MSTAPTRLVGLAGFVLPLVLAAGLSGCTAPPVQVAEADKPACAKEYSTGSAIRGVKCRTDAEREASKREAQDVTDGIRNSGRVMIDPAGTK